MAEQLGVANGPQWFRCGWDLFRADTASWVLVTLVFFALAVLAEFVPFVGPLAFVIALPVLLGGIYRMAAGDAAVGVAGLFGLFRDPTVRTPLMVLGLMLLGISVGLSLLFGLALVGSIPEELLMSAEPDPAALFDALLSFRNLLLLMVLMLVQLMLSFGLFFAVAAVTFGRVEPMPALRDGIKAALANLLPVLAFGALYVVLAILAAIPFGLGFLVLLPVTLLAGYCAYREVFGKSGGGQLSA